MAIAFLLQGALGGALVIIIGFVLIVTAVVAAGAFGGALGGRGGAESGEAQTERVVPPGTILAGVGMGLAAIGAYFPSLSMGVVGVIMGAIAYYRGARVLGGVVSILSLAAIFIAFLLGGEGYKF
jgi:hypothetical protein